MDSASPVQESSEGSLLPEAPLLGKRRAIVRNDADVLLRLRHRLLLHRAQFLHGDVAVDDVVG